MGNNFSVVEEKKEEIVKKTVQKEIEKKINLKYFDVAVDIPTVSHKLWNQGYTEDYKYPVMQDRRYDFDVCPARQFRNVHNAYSLLYMISVLLFDTLYFKNKCQYFPDLEKINSLMNHTKQYSMSEVLEMFKTTNLPALDIEIDDELTPFYDMDYYYLMNDDKLIRYCIENEYLVLCNLTCYNTIFHVGKDGKIELPKKENNQFEGMTCILLVGYNETAWIAKFPFGKQWGNNGYGYIPYEYFDRYNRDRWIIDIPKLNRSLKIQTNAETVIPFDTNTDKVQSEQEEVQKSQEKNGETNHEKRSRNFI
jgi:hypothetical protein